jgi:hypothetical protein
MTDGVGSGRHWKIGLRIGIVVTIASFLVQSFGLGLVGYPDTSPLRDLFAGVGVVAFLATCYYWSQLRDR